MEYCLLVWVLPITQRFVLDQAMFEQRFLYPPVEVIKNGSIVVAGHQKAPTSQFLAVFQFSGALFGLDQFQEKRIIIA